MLRCEDFSEVLGARKGNGDAVEEGRSRLPAMRDINLDSSASEGSVEVVVRLGKHVISGNKGRTPRNATHIERTSLDRGRRGKLNDVLALDKVLAGGAGAEGDGRRGSDEGEEGEAEVNHGGSSDVP